MTDASHLIERLARLETGQLCDVLAEAGLPDQVLAPTIRHVSGERCFAGTALPARGRMLARTRRPIPVPGNDALDEAVFAGAVVLIDTGGFLGGGCLGGLIATGLRHKGAVAIVTDGAVRDAKEIGRLGLAAYAAAVTPAAASRRWSLIEVDQPIALPGVAAPVQVRPGDLVRGDDDGIVVVPGAFAATVIEDTEEVARIEEKMAEALRAGEQRAEVALRPRSPVATLPVRGSLDSPLASSTRRMLRTSRSSAAWSRRSARPKLCTTCCGVRCGVPAAPQAAST